jgi:hypothetical protein
MKLVTALVPPLMPMVVPLADTLRAKNSQSSPAGL